MVCKSKTVAAALCFFLGGIGAHRYYLGYDDDGFLETCGCGCRLFCYAILYWGSPADFLSGAAIFLLLGIYTLAKTISDFTMILSGRLTEKVDPIFEVLPDAPLPNPSKSKLTAALLAFFFGGVGAHRYYLGYKADGLVYTCGFILRMIGHIYIFLARIHCYLFTGMEFIIFCLYMVCSSIPAICAFVDFILILCEKLLPADGTCYVQNQKNASQSIRQEASSSDWIDVLEKLSKLHEQGVLTDEEFAQKKEALLKRM